MKILVTGGAGYIGSHFVRYLVENNEQVVVLDNLERGHKEAFPDGIQFVQTDLRNETKLKGDLSDFEFDAVVHFAAYAYVGESVENPKLYYINNVIGSINLLNLLVERRIKKIVFSSTCSLYGNPLKIPIKEDEPTKPINPYAQTKLTIEKVLNDYSKAYGINYSALRYFNAAGAHPSGEIGESHTPETHLIPLVLEAALEKREKILVFGNDYDTPDGTCIRDYIHVMDLADAHYRALAYLNDKEDSLTVNLGTGKGSSVKVIIDKCGEITGKKIKSEIVERRKGDPAVLVADNNKAKNKLGWEPKYSLDDIISSAWNWHTNQKY